MKCKEHDSFIPGKGSQSASNYFLTVNESFSLFHFVIDTVLSSDFVAHVAQSALDDVPKEADSPEELARKSPGNRTRRLRKHAQDLLQLFWVRIVDNFQTYIVEILREVLKKQPNMLKSRQQTIDLEQILQFSTMDELLHHIIEAKVNSLSYQGFSQLQEWCNSKGIPLSVSSENSVILSEMIATRNLIVHNRGIVDKKYLSNVTNCSFHLGERRRLQVDELFSSMNVLSASVRLSDDAIVSKFALDVVEIDREDARKQDPN